MTDDRKTPPVRVVETHISVLVFVGDRVYKLRKPVHFDFLDFTDRAVREADCRREVELNRRLAPDVYLGVADIVMEGEAIDHMVVMRALPDERRLATLVREGVDVDIWLARVATALAEFHAGARRSPAISEAGTGHALQAAWDANFEETRRFVGTILDPVADEEIRHTVSRWLASHRALLEDRIASGRVCDGHGDLQAEDIFCLDDGIRILDCIEFSDDLRYGDVCADVAFLAMDLERLGRPDAAERFVLQYEAQAGERLPRPLLHHYIAQRAYVRAKVACLQVEQGRRGCRSRRPGTARTGPSARPPQPAGARAGGRPPRYRQEHARRRAVGRDGVGPAALGRAPAGAAALRGAARHRRRTPGATSRPPSVPCTTSCSSGPAGTSTRASRSSSTPRGSMRGNVRRRCGRPPRPAASSWSCAAPVRSRWRRHGSNERSRGRDDVSEATPQVRSVMAERMDPWPSASTIDTSRRSPAECVSWALREIAPMSGPA